MGTVYLVTGAAGHLGNSIVSRLAETGCTAIRALLLPNESDLPLCGLPVEIFRGDVRDRASLLPFFSLSDGDEAIVFHCAGIVSIASRYDRCVYEVNVLGTKNIVDLCEAYAVRRLVHVSSVHAIPDAPHGAVTREISFFDPAHVVGLYAKTKAEATQYVLDRAHAGLNACVVHPSGIVGPNDYGRGHMTQMIIDYLNGSLSACIRGGYDFVDVRDVANGILLAAEYGERGECYILSGDHYSALTLLDCVSRLTGRKKIRTILPMWFAKATAPLAELYYRIKHQPPLFTRYSMMVLSSGARFSHEKAARALGYTVRAMETTMRDTVDWLVRNNRIERKRPRVRRSRKKVKA